MKEIEDINEERSNDSTGVFKDKSGTIYYLLNGKHHRDDGPATIYDDGICAWYINDKKHRIDGPALYNQIFYSGHKYWFFNGMRHRPDGPAIEWSGGDGDGDWFYYGKRAKSKKEFYNSDWRKKIEIMRFL